MDVKNRQRHAGEREIATFKKRKDEQQGSSGTEKKTM